MVQKKLHGKCSNYFLFNDVAMYTYSMSGTVQKKKKLGTACWTFLLSFKLTCFPWTHILLRTYILYDPSIGFGGHIHSRLLRERIAPAQATDGLGRPSSAYHIRVFFFVFRFFLRFPGFFSFRLFVFGFRLFVFSFR
jgi:hypothetical protein